MNDNLFGRSQPILGVEAMEKLKNSTVCIFGLGGVGSFAFEALVRAGVGRFSIIDYAKVDATNINRQLIALESTIGSKKTDAASKRAHDINPGVLVECHDLFLDESNIEKCIPSETSYIIDAVDTVSAKLLLVKYAKKQNIPIISCMGTGNKVHPEKLGICDIFKTSVDPLARVMRTELKKMGIKKLQVVWSDEVPLVKGDDLPINREGKKVPASISYVPSSAGLMMASVVVNEIAGIS